MFGVLTIWKFVKSLFSHFNNIWGIFLSGGGGSKNVRYIMIQIFSRFIKKNGKKTFFQESLKHVKHFLGWFFRGVPYLIFSMRFLFKIKLGGTPNFTFLGYRKFPNPWVELDRVESWSLQFHFVVIQVFEEI